MSDKITAENNTTANTSTDTLQTRSKTSSKFNTGSTDDLENEYQFFRSFVKNNVFKMTDVMDQRKISTWLYQCDMEQDKFLRCAVIKLMLISLQHTGGNLSIFCHSAPSEIPFLTRNPNTFGSLNEMVEFMLNNSDEDSDDEDQVGGDKTNGCQTAAVSSDLTSLATTSTNDNCVQVFYARSDRPLDTWYLPPQIIFPVDKRSPSHWERALSTWPADGNVTTREKILSATDSLEIDMPVYLEDDGVSSGPKWNTSDSDLSPMEIKCRELMSEQTAIGFKEEFRWYEHSRLDGFLRPTNDMSIDKNTCDHEKTQLDLDERAVNVVNRLYPGRVRIMLDAGFVAEVTGIDVSRPTSGSNEQRTGTVTDLNSHLKTLTIDTSDCKNSPKRTDATVLAVTTESPQPTRPECPRTNVTLTAAKCVDDDTAVTSSPVVTTDTETSRPEETCDTQQRRPFVSCRCTGGSNSVDGQGLRCADGSSPTIRSNQRHHSDEIGPSKAACRDSSDAPVRHPSCEQSYDVRGNVAGRDSPVTPADHQSPAVQSPADSTAFQSRPTTSTDPSQSLAGSTGHENVAPPSAVTPARSRFVDDRSPFCAIGCRRHLYQNRRPTVWDPTTDRQQSGTAFGRTTSGRPENDRSTTQTYTQTLSRVRQLKRRLETFNRPLLRLSRTNILPTNGGSLHEIFETNSKRPRPSRTETENANETSTTLPSSHNES